MKLKSDLEELYGIDDDGDELIFNKNSKNDDDDDFEYEEKKLSYKQFEKLSDSKSFDTKLELLDREDIPLKILKKLAKEESLEMKMEILDHEKLNKEIYKEVVNNFCEEYISKNYVIEEYEETEDLIEQMLSSKFINKESFEKIYDFVKHTNLDFHYNLMAKIDLVNVSNETFNEIFKEYPEFLLKNETINHKILNEYIDTDKKKIIKDKVDKNHEDYMGDIIIPNNILMESILENKSITKEQVEKICNKKDLRNAAKNLLASNKYTPVDYLIELKKEDKDYWGALALNDNLPKQYLKEIVSEIDNKFLVAEVFKRGKLTTEDVKDINNMYIKEIQLLVAGSSKTTMGVFMDLLKLKDKDITNEIAKNKIVSTSILDKIAKENMNDVEIIKSLIANPNLDILTLKKLQDHKIVEIKEYSNKGITYRQEKEDMKLREEQTLKNQKKIEEESFSLNDIEIFLKKVEEIKLVKLEVVKPTIQHEKDELKPSDKERLIAEYNKKLQEEKNKSNNSNRI